MARLKRRLSHIIALPARAWLRSKSPRTIGNFMPPAARSRSVGEGAPAAASATRALDMLISGHSVDAIADARKHTRARVERNLRAELNAISIRPAQDYAKLQIRRLEAIVGKLAEKANDGDLAAVERILKI